MLSNELNHITLGGNEYPIKCDMLVLEKIQDKYEDISEFENKLMGFTPSKNEDGTNKRDKKGNTIGITGIPDIRALNFALTAMIREGLSIAGEKADKTDEEIIRSIDMTPTDLSTVLHEEFIQCFRRKNEKTTQKN